MANTPDSAPQLSRFLAWLRPPGSAFPGVALTAIPVEGGRTTTETHFDAKAGADWSARFAGRQNCYYMVNPPIGALPKKAKKEEVAAVALLHVDIDPEKGKDWSTERERILAALESYRPRPSAVIDSGNGFQALWRLREPERLTGPHDWARLEAYNRQLAVDLRGDSTHDVSRLLRLPGPPNLPNKKKRDAGRVERPTSIVWMEDSAYDLEEFTAAPVQERASAKGSPGLVPSNLPPADLDALPATVDQRTRMLIVEGDDPADPTRYRSMSEPMWAVLHALVRARCTDEQIASVLLDPKLGISDHPLRQKHSVEYVAHQIAKARAENEHPMLRELNEKHAVITLYGNKTRVVSWQPSALRDCPDEIVAQTFEDFRNRYLNMRVQTGTDEKGNPRYAPAGKWWLEHPLRRQYRSVTFDPAATPGEDGEDLNIWSGLAVKAPAGGLAAAAPPD